MKKVSRCFAVLLVASFGMVSIGLGQDLVVRMVDTEGSPGDSIGVTMEIDNTTADSIQGFSFSFTNFSGDLFPEDVAAGPALQALNGGSGPDFLQVNLFGAPSPDGTPAPGGTGINCGTVFSFLDNDRLDPGVGLNCLLMTWQIAPATRATETVLEFCDCIGTPMVASVVVVEGASVVPDLLEAATISIIEAPAYIRGDPNGSGALDLADPIYTLDRLFQSGPAICEDAMDANADGAIDLADVLYLLDAINGFGPLPSAPFPNCGAVAPVLGCELSSCS